MMQVRRAIDNCWSITSYALACGSPLAVAPIVSAMFGLPPLMTFPAALTIALLTMVACLALALEPPEADVIQILWDRFAAGIPVGGEVCLRFVVMLLVCVRMERFKLTSA